MGRPLDQHSSITRVPAASRLSGQSPARIMRGHAVMGGCPPRVNLGSRLRKLHVAGRALNGHKVVLALFQVIAGPGTPASITAGNGHRNRRIASMHCASLRIAFRGRQLAKEKAAAGGSSSVRSSHREMSLPVGFAPSAVPHCRSKRPPPSASIRGSSARRPFRLSRPGSWDGARNDRDQMSQAQHRER